MDLAKVIWIAKHSDGTIVKSTKDKAYLDIKRNTLESLKFVLPKRLGKDKVIRTIYRRQGIPHWSIIWRLRSQVQMSAMGDDRDAHVAERFWIIEDFEERKGGIYRIRESGEIERHDTYNKDIKPLRLSKIDTL